MAGGAELVMIRQFLRYMFVSRAPDEDRVEVVDEVPEPVADDSARPDIERQARVGIIVMISRVLALVFGMGFGYILISDLLRPAVPTPAIIANILWAIIGYFGGAFSTFLGNRPPTRRRRSRSEKCLNPRGQ